MSSSKLEIKLVLQPENKNSVEKYDTCCSVSTGLDSTQERKKKIVYKLNVSQQLIAIKRKQKSSPADCGLYFFSIYEWPMYLKNLKNAEC